MNRRLLPWSITSWRQRTAGNTPSRNRASVTGPTMNSTQRWPSLDSWSTPTVLSFPQISRDRHLCATPSGPILEATCKKCRAVGARFLPTGLRSLFAVCSTTPTPLDLTTGVYHEYDLKRTLILLNQKGRQVLISVSKQIDESSIGKKGVILGNDSDWTYFYSNEPGTMKTGLGWAKSYIYDYFSVVVYAKRTTRRPPWSGPELSNGFARAGQVSILSSRTIYWPARNGSPKIPEWFLSRPVFLLRVS